MRKPYYLTEIYQKLKDRNNWLKPSEIKLIRKSYLLTQVNFADFLNISFGTYKAWEIGHRAPCSPAMALLYVARDYPEIFLKNRKKLLAKLQASQTKMRKD